MFSRGYILIQEPDGPVKEIDTFTCYHCNTIHKIPPFVRPDDVGGVCRRCGGLICPHCVGKGCDPLEEKLKRVETSNDMSQWFVHS